MPTPPVQPTPQPKKNAEDLINDLDSSIDLQFSLYTWIKDGDGPSDIVSKLQTAGYENITLADISKLEAKYYSDNIFAWVGPYELSVTFVNGDPSFNTPAESFQFQIGLPTSINSPEFVIFGQHPVEGFQFSENTLTTEVISSPTGAIYDAGLVITFTRLTDKVPTFSGTLTLVAEGATSPTATYQVEGVLLLPNSSDSKRVDWYNTQVAKSAYAIAGAITFMAFVFTKGKSIFALLKACTASSGSTEDALLELVPVPDVLPNATESAQVTLQALLNETSSVTSLTEQAAQATAENLAAEGDTAAETTADEFADSLEDFASNPTVDVIAEDSVEDLLEGL